jgi:glycosyltransferase involved in cell wall biosynthesis
MQIDTPLRVSAIIATYNRRGYVRRAIDSILAQTVAVDEIIVVDDEKSTDNIAEAIKDWYGDGIRVILGQGGGLSGARRRGIEEARGEWIAFLDSDDDWPPERNEQFLRAASLVDNDVAWIFGNTRIIFDEGRSDTFYQEFGLDIQEWPKVFEDSLTPQFPFQFGVLSSSFIRREALLQCGCFKTPLQHSEDVLAGFQVALRYRFAAIPPVVGSYFRTSDLASNSAVLKGMFGPDYYRARVLAFGLVAESGRRKPWVDMYASDLRSLIKLLARSGQSPRTMAFEQFRFGNVSLKGLLFYLAALAGPKGLGLWDKIAGWNRKYLRSGQPMLTQNTSGFKAYTQALFDKK